MSNVISRRDFLKASSAVGLSAAINPVSAVTTTTQKSRVVIATDTSAVSGTGNPNAAKIQDLVDHAVMTFTGKVTKGEAYEALFPQPVTSSTKIALKRNDLSGGGTVNTAVTNALANGLKSMQDGKFSGTINNVLSTQGASSYISAATYVINCPVAWMHMVFSVTLSLKNQMNYKGAPGPSFHNDRSWMYQYVNDFKGKQVLSLMDAVAGRSNGGPGGSPNFRAGTIIVGSDLVAVDYNALRLLEKQGANTSSIATGDSQLKTAESNGAGTCNPAKMEIIEIKAPWPSTGIINGSDTIMQSLNIGVLNQGNKVDFIIPGASSKQASVAIFDMMGNVIWQAQNIQGESVSWNHRTMYGGRVSPGMYIFRIACGGSIMRGTVMAARFE